MKIATRTTLAYTILTAFILFIFSYVLYTVTKKNEIGEFFDRLYYKVTWRSEFILDAELDSSTIKLIHIRNQQILNEADLTIFNEDNQIVFSDFKKPLVSIATLQKLKKAKALKWISAPYQYIGVIHQSHNHNYYIFGRAKDITGLEHLNRFKTNLIILYSISIILILLAGFAFSYYTIYPIKHIISQIKEISEYNLSKRIKQPKRKDELNELTLAFNTTFNKLEKSFNNQKVFVTTISHEFRTPLATMIAELELAKELNKSIDEYKLTIDNVLEDAQNATVLSNALLDFARANYDISQINMTEIRLDDILMESKLYLKKKFNDYIITVEYANTKSNQEDFYNYIGNPNLLQIAFMNLMENSCKYSSDKTSYVTIERDEKFIKILFSDKGIGICKEDQNNIFDLFYRGRNKKYNKGYGIGLSIVKQIVHLHSGQIFLQSEIEKGTTFSIHFPIKYEK